MRWSDRLAAAVLLVAAMVGLAGTPASAHDGNVGYSEISVGAGQLDYDLYLDRRFLATALPDLRIDDATVDAGAAGKLLAEGVAVSAAGRPVAASEVRVGHSSTKKLTHLGGVSLLSDAPLLHIHARYDLGGAVDDYLMEYRLFLPDKGQQPHSNLAWIHQGGQTRTFIFAPGAATLTPGAGELVASAEDGGSGFPVALAVAAGVAVLVGAGVLVLLARGRRRAGTGGGGAARTAGPRRRAGAVSSR